MSVILISNSENSPFPFLILFIIGCLVLGLYFLPTILAFIKNKDNKIAIAALNFFLGWSLVGWVISLVWSLSKEKYDRPIFMNTNASEDELDKLSKLKSLLDSGAITQEEFEYRKQKILS